MTALSQATLDAIAALLEQAAAYRAAGDLNSTLRTMREANALAATLRVATVEVAS